MGYIVKLLDTGNYLIEGLDGEMDTTNDREIAIVRGKFDDYENAKETTEFWSGRMVLGEDYVIESI